jgi:hypothetical protein
VRAPLAVFACEVLAWSLLAPATATAQFASGSAWLTSAGTTHSPDGKSSVTARSVTPLDSEPHITLDVTGTLGPSSVESGPGAGSEVLWAPNSQAVALTTVSEGLSGAYRTVVIGRSPHGLQRRDLTTLIRHTFGRPTLCTWPEVPTVAAIAWLDGSRHLLVAAQIVPRPNCDSYGTFTAYEIDPWTLHIVHRYDQLEAKHLYAHQLGPWLLAANDNCLRQPPTCYVPANHPELAGRGTPASAQPAPTRSAPRSGPRE